ncbi:type I methionyl aminopeptidase [Candidatus Microgenomates bacterium]|nr:type I methionyl aminopeptidase [Candidatus Microgenomates bacterium]
MISIKTEAEIEIMKKSGRILASVMEETIKQVKIGVTTAKLDQFAEKLIKEKDGQCSFKMVPKYKWATCMCVNDCVVHGVPNQYQLKEGDILGMDIGVFYQGFHADMARTLLVRNQKPKTKNQKQEGIKKFLETGENTLKKAISTARIGNRIGHISKVIQENIEGAGYSIVKNLVGHGVGRKLHEDPQIPGFLRGKIKDSPLLKKGMTIAIEVIYNQGSDKIVLKKSDGWTILTKDDSLSGLFENTIAITEKGPTILTK